MGARCAAGLIDSTRVLDETLARSPRLWKARLGTALLVLAAGCNAPAPLAGKSCPCATGYFCCESSMTCESDVQKCACPTKPLGTQVITTGGTSVDGGAGAAVIYGAGSDQWISYTYAGTGEPLPTLEATPDGTGFHVTATFNRFNGGTQTFEGAGLSYLSDSCLDGAPLSGLQFDFDGDLGGSQLTVGVVSNNNVSTDYARGTCTAGMMCYGPTAAFNPKIGTNPVPFGDLIGGPTQTFDRGHIVNVQWQVSAAAQLGADFTISNVQFY